ncbi:ankyrin repeat [Chlorella sorokiniana]|uniref:Ankyrin repeat n=1 Tax=Chlorella sorokiniana TaxID=3076 RepID=A0A2P6TGW3_CHLSO|nr:ankyrin repeat [Chlorella sorokiniana]|eukprot:PRW33529.1 ankyrin repeat [Chlorella sorokiniana]
MGHETGPAEADCPCSRFATGERASELALRCCCMCGVRSGRTALHTAAAAGDVKVLTAGLWQLAAEQSTQQQAEAGAQLGAAQQPQAGERQPDAEEQPAQEGPAQPQGGQQPSSSQVSCGTALPPDSSPFPINSHSGGGGRSGTTRVELPLDAAGNSPLHVAAAAAQPAAVAVLLQHCVASELERRNCFGLTPLHSLAASPQPGSASEAVLRLLLHAGADPLARTLPPQDAGMDASYDDSALSLVAQHAWPGAGAATLMVCLLGAGLDPLEPNGTLWTSPLEYACAAGDALVVAHCVWAAQTSPIYRKHGISAAYLLALAAAYGSADVVDLLLHPPAWLRTILAGPDDVSTSSDDELSDLPDPWSVLEGPEGPDASRLPSDDGDSGGGPSRTVRGPAPDEPLFADWQLDYCLRIAVAQGQLDACRCLVAAGASGAQLRCGWRTAQDWEEELRDSGWQGRFPCLHAPGANLLDPPLHLALQLRHLHIAEWLIKRTAATFPRLDCLNRTALHWAVLLGEHKLLRWLLESGQYRVRGEGEIRAIDVDDNEDYSALAYALRKGDPEAVALLCRYGADLDYSVPSVRHRKTSVLSAALLVEAPEARGQIARTLLQYGAEADAYSILNAIRFGRVEELTLLLAAAEAAAEGGEALEPGEVATLLQRTVMWSQADCLEVLLAHGLSPSVVLKGNDGRRRTLLKTWYNTNYPMWDPNFGYSEQEGRVALVLAGADPRGVLIAIEAQLPSAPELQEVAERLRRPIWMPEQHHLWPVAFKAAAAELLRCLQSVDRRLAGNVAGMAVEEGGQQGQQAQAAAAAGAAEAEVPHPAFPPWMRQRVVEHVGADWEWPAAAE